MKLNPLHFATLLILLLIEGCGIHVAPSAKIDRTDRQIWKAYDHDWVFVTHHVGREGPIFANQGGVLLDASSEKITQTLADSSGVQVVVKDSIYFLQKDRTYKHIQSKCLIWCAEEKIYALVREKPTRVTDCEVSSDNNMDMRANSDGTANFVGEWDPVQHVFKMDRYLTTFDLASVPTKTRLASAAYLVPR